MVVGDAGKARAPFRVLLSNEQIVQRIGEMARQIAADAGEEPFLLVMVVEGARTFAQHLRALLPGDLPLFEIRASSYGSGTVSSGQVTLSTGADLPCRGRTVLLLEDIVDTGRTVDVLRRHFAEQGAAACRTATLLSKPSRRVVEVDLDYVGFEIPDEFVIGFGLDFDGRYRELPDLVVYEAGV
jgi:hypoxanthine phosphoribosyltransferase